MGGFSASRPMRSTFYSSQGFQGDEYSSPQRRYQYPSSYNNLTYGNYGSPQKSATISAGQMDLESINKKIAEILKITEIIACHVASISAEGDAAPSSNFTAQDSEELWRIVSGGS